MISDKIAEEKEQAQREFEQLLTDFEHKKIDTHTLEQILKRKAEQNKDLEKQLRDFSRYMTSKQLMLLFLIFRIIKIKLRNGRKTI